MPRVITVKPEVNSERAFNWRMVGKNKDILVVDLTLKWREKRLFSDLEMRMWGVEKYDKEESTFKGTFIFDTDSERSLITNPNIEFVMVPHEAKLARCAENDKSAVLDCKNFLKTTSGSVDMGLVEWWFAPEEMLCFDGLRLDGIFNPRHARSLDEDERQQRWSFANLSQQGQI